MQKRIGNWFWTSALVLAACGGVEAPSSLSNSRAALATTANTTSTASAGSAASAGSTGGTVGSGFVAPPGEECEREHGQYYCARGHEDKDYYGADAAPPDAGAHGECEDDEHHGEEYSDDHRHDQRDDDDDRSGSNRGPH